MKKVTIIFAIFSLVLISTVRADIRLGVKAGVNLASTSFNKDILKSANFTGFQVGPTVEFSLPVTGLGIDAAVLYSQQGLKLKGANFKERQSTLDIPVNLKFKLGVLSDLGVYLAAGPYVSFKLSGNNFSLITRDVKNEFKNKTFGAGLNFGAGVELLKHLQVGVNYKLGLTDEYKSLDRSASNLRNLKGKTRVWSITTTYFF
jgi:hypothetical protein